MSRWIYKKLWINSAGGEAMDDIVSDYVRPTAGELSVRGLIDRFFFLRYVENMYHIRYRLHPINETQIDEVEHVLRRSAGKQRLPLMMTSAVYVPELEKYGGPVSLEIVERQFWSSSKLVLNLLPGTRERSSRRLFLAALLLYRLLEVAQLTPETAAGVLYRYIAYWNSAYSASGGTIASELLLEETGITLDEIMDPGNALCGIHGRAESDALSSWLQSATTDIAELSRMCMDGVVGTGLTHILCNLAHTMNNRLGLCIAEEIYTARIVWAHFAKYLDSTPAASARGSEVCRP
jgi:thiopeptide-type bacteriocin biosynthesis protein